MAPSLLAALLACSPDTAPPDQEDFTAPRDKMLQKDLAGRGIRDERVLAAMGAVERHRFVDASLKPLAYADRALPIGSEQTISQPYIVAIMTELLELKGGEKILEVGTGSGYQAAVLAEMGCEVWTIEILPELAASAKALLANLGYDKVHVRAGDGYAGWPEAAPFDGIIITAATPRFPSPLIDQLKEGGRAVLPLGEETLQTLVAGPRKDGLMHLDPVLSVAFVPMTGQVREDD